MKKRLFLFAAYDKDGVVGPSLLWYVKSLSKIGDVVLVADNSLAPAEMEKLEPWCAYCSGCSHGEYDFGSYKRAFSWAKDNLELSSYDYIYLVNDSVYGPLSELYPYIIQMEALGTEAFSFVLNPNRRHAHLQSWFIGLQESVASQPWFEEFLMSVSKEESKTDVCVKYETGLTRLLKSNGVSFDALLKLSGRKIYNEVKKLYLMDFPFVKKAAFTRHNGSLGRQLLYVLGKVSDECREMIIQDAQRTLGAGYVDWLLCRNPFEIARRYMGYLAVKLGLRRTS